MRSTLIDIAREAGVSSATVDRVLNNRAGVREPDARDRHRDRAAPRLHLGWRRRRCGRASVGRTARLRAADGHQHLHQDAAPASSRCRAPRDRTSTCASHLIEGFNPDTLARTLQELGDDTQGVGVIALDHPTVREAIRALSARGVKVVTLASDILHVPRIAYVGIDNRQAGRLAGYLLARLLGTTSPKQGGAVRRLALLSRP